MDEGYIKYQSFWTRKKISVDPLIFRELNRRRDYYYRKNWIGVDPSGIGFGNISMRLNGNSFIISGSATGGLEALNLSHYAIVTDYDFARNRLSCTGETEASSESLTHAALYESDAAIQCVLHMHSRALWIKHRRTLPATPEDVAYGTPQMAYAIQEARRQINGREGVILMAGHEDGIIAFGESFHKIEAVMAELC